MKLIARLMPLGKESAEAVLSFRSAHVLAVTSGRYAIDADDPALPRILDAGDTGRGFWVGAQPIFSRSELDGVGHYEALCRKIVRESSADFTWNDAVRQRTRLVDAGGWAPIRLMSGLSLTRIPLKPNMIGSIGDWTDEYVAGPAVAAAFRDARLTGMTFVPVMNPRTRAPHAQYAQLFSDAILPAAAIDDSVQRIVSAFPSEDGRLRHLGCLAYAHGLLRDRPDCNRTAEPWAGLHGWPAWVVSARLMSAFASARLRGGHFRPVLDTSTHLYAEYAARWQRLRDVVDQTEHSTFEGSRW